MFKKITESIITKKKLSTGEDNKVLFNSHNVNKLNFFEYFYLLVFDFNFFGKTLLSFVEFFEEFMKRFAIVVICGSIIIFFPVFILISYISDKRK